MKKLIILLTLIVIATGCIKRDTMEDITIYTTIYPIEYITNRLYGEYSEIFSIYPRGVNVKLENCTDCNELYTLTEKQLEDYSKADLFIFNSLLYEGTYVEPMRNSNNNLKIINAGDRLEITDYYGVEELWLDPSRLSTLARNIKAGLNEFITNYYLKNDIEENFNTLKEELDRLESKMTELTKNADNDFIIVGNEVFGFLGREKYGLTVHVLNENTTDKTKEDVKSLINDGKVKYIYIKKYDEVNDVIKELIEGSEIEVIEIHTLANLTEDEINSKKDYFMIMNENIELLRKGLYN